MGGDNWVLNVRAQFSAICREKIRYLEEGGEETADIYAKYPREPPEIAPPEFTKDQVRNIPGIRRIFAEFSGYRFLGYLILFFAYSDLFSDIQKL